MSAAPRILVVKLSSLGDALHGLPTAAALKETLGADITWAVQPEFASMVRSFACVSNVVEVPRPSHFRPFLKALRDLHRLPPFDMIVDLQGLLKSAVVTMAARGGPVIGPSFAREGSFLFYRELAGRKNRSRHAVDECLDLMDHLGLARPQPPRFPLSVPVIDPAERFSVGTDLDGPFVAVAPYSRWETKNWPESHFAETIALLVREHRARVFLIGGKGDREGADRIAAASGAPVANLCGSLSLVESAGLLKRCAALLCNDSGPMHIAAALGIPCVAMFGPTSPERTGPYGPGHTILRAAGCVPCHKRTCSRGDFVCLRAITSRAAADAVIGAVSKRNA